MATALPERGDRPEQLWLDVARPIQSRPRRSGAPSKTIALGLGGTQMELAIQPRVVSSMPVRVVRVPPPEAVTPPTVEVPDLSFAEWLLAQGKRGGLIGELAKAVKVDRLFPRTGSADDVRRRFGAAGADGDAFAALEDAEREYDRLWT